MKTVYRWCLRVVLAPFFVFVAYIVAALVLGWVPASLPAQYHPPHQPQDQLIYVVSNGVHINLVLPTQQAGVDWRPWLNQSEQHSAWTWIGWGSEVFYTQVPTWGDLTPSLAMRALFWDDGVLFVRAGVAPALSPPQRVRKIALTQAQYHSLVADIRAQFAQHTSIPGFEHFYPAKDRYQPVLTCNEWVRRRLQRAGVSVPVWTPFDRSLLWYLPTQP